MQNKQWYVLSENGTEYGPLSFEELQLLPSEKQDVTDLSYAWSSSTNFDLTLLYKAARFKKASRGQTRQVRLAAIDQLRSISHISRLADLNWVYAPLCEADMDDRIPLFGNNDDEMDDDIAEQVRLLNIATQAWNSAFSLDERLVHFYDGLPAWLRRWKKAIIAKVDKLTTVAWGPQDSAMLENLLTEWLSFDKDEVLLYLRAKNKLKWLTDIDGALQDLADGYELPGMCINAEEICSFLASLRRGYCADLEELESILDNMRKCCFSILEKHPQNPIALLVGAYCQLELSGNDKRAYPLIAGLLSVRPDWVKDLVELFNHNLLTTQFLWSAILGTASQGIGRDFDLPISNGDYAPNRSRKCDSWEYLAQAVLPLFRRTKWWVPSSPEETHENFMQAWIKSLENGGVPLTTARKYLLDIYALDINPPHQLGGSMQHLQSQRNRNYKLYEIQSSVLKGVPEDAEGSKANVIAIIDALMSLDSNFPDSFLQEFHNRKSIFMKMQTLKERSNAIFHLVGELVFAASNEDEKHEANQGE
jgi:hypothetical protein